jgi:hypothetical protein
MDETEARAVIIEAQERYKDDKDVCAMFQRELERLEVEGVRT